MKKANPIGFLRLSPQYVFAVESVGRILSFIFRKKMVSSHEPNNFPDAKFPKPSFEGFETLTKRIQAYSKLFGKGDSKTIPNS